jgi:hypothetical protein
MKLPVGQSRSQEETQDRIDESTGVDPPDIHVEGFYFPAIGIHNESSIISLRNIL